MPELRLTRRAADSIRSLPQPVQEAVSDGLTLLAADPQGHGKALRGQLRGLWAARVDQYRVLYTIEESGQVVVRAVRHRAIAYKSDPR